jgi:hypothetical protein
MLQLLRYEDELIKSREIVTVEAALDGAAASLSSNVNNPIETVDEFQKKEKEVQRSTKQTPTVKKMPMGQNQTKKNSAPSRVVKKPGAK